jgi:hypothetical protein
MHAAPLGGDDEVDDRIRAVEDTTAKLAVGEAVTSFPSSAGIIDRKILTTISAWLGLRSHLTAPEHDKASQSTTLVRLATDRYTFGKSEARKPYAVPADGPPIARTFRGGRDSLRTELAARYAAASNRAPAIQALSDAMLVLEGRCLQASRTLLSLRLARTVDAIVLDLGRADGQVVRIGPDEWSVGRTPPGIIWQRTELTGELPLPERGGSLDGLRDLINVTDEAWSLLRGLLVASLIPDIPHPVGLFRGPQGAGKSSATQDHSSPYERAQLLALRASFREQWQLHGGIEDALVDSLALAFTHYLSRTARLQVLSTTEAKQEDGYLRQHREWSPPRVEVAAWIEQAAVMMERFHRLFLRTLRTLQDYRRGAAPRVAIAQADQVHVAEQQINVTAGPTLRT